MGHVLENAIRKPVKYNFFRSFKMKKPQILLLEMTNVTIPRNLWGFFRILMGFFFWFSEYAFFHMHDVRMSVGGQCLGSDIFTIIMQGRF